MKLFTNHSSWAAAFAACILFFSGTTGFCQAEKCNELFISEYVDGPFKNKAVEIHNPGENPVDLANYSILVYMNGAPTALETPLSGTIAPGGVHVLAHPLADAGVMAVTNQTSVKYNPNGDDAVVLSKSGVPIDIIGEIGVNPGMPGWEFPLPGGGTGSTRDMALARLPHCAHGETDWAECRTHWRTFPPDYYAGLGSHVSRCAGYPQVSFASSSGVCDENLCGVITLEINISEPTPPGFDYTISFFNGSITSGSPATPGVDCQDASTIPFIYIDNLSPLSHEIEFEIYGDLMVEPTEKVSVNISISGSASPGTWPSHTVNIQNDDMIGVMDALPDDFLGVTYDTENQSVHIFPSSGKLNGNIKVYNTIGQMVSGQYYQSESNAELATDTWPKAVYTIHYQDETRGFLCKKILIY